MVHAAKRFTIWPNSELYYKMFKSYIENVSNSTKMYSIYTHNGDKMML